MSLKLPGQKSKRAPRLPESAFVPRPDLETFVRSHAGRFKWDSVCRVALDPETSRQHWRYVHLIRKEPLENEPD